MKTIETLKNQHAQDCDYTDWEDLRQSVQDDLEYEQHWTEVCVKAQKEALEKAAENAKINMDLQFDWYSVDRTSITNEQNLVR